MNSPRLSITRKFIVCLLTGLVTGAAVMRLGNRFLSNWLPHPTFLATAMMILLCALILPVVWHLKEKNGHAEIPIIRWWVETVMRFAITLDLAMFGWQKIFHLQLNVPMGMLDEPFSSFSGEWLTWAYFGYSYPFAVFVGLSQIIGAALLMFERTNLLGTIVIIPIIFNIVLIDFFYALPIGVLVHASIMLSCVVYLLMTEYDRLFQFFLKHKNAVTLLPGANNWKHAIRLVVFLIPITMIVLHGSPNKHPRLRGKYEVADLKVNGLARPLIDCDSVLTTMYFDIGNECVMEFNGIERRLIGTYLLNESTNEMTVNWHFPQGVSTPLKASVKYENNGLIVKGRMFDDFEVRLNKVK